MFRKAVVLLILMVLLTGCASKEEGHTVSENGPELILRFAEVNPAGHIITRTDQYFADKVNELSNGRIEIKVFDSGQLGDDSQYYSQMQMGALDMYRGNCIALAEIPDMLAGVLALPYLFRDDRHFWKVCRSDLGEKILNNIYESGSGMMGLCFVDEGTRNIMSIRKEITNLHDIKDLRIRSMRSPLEESTIDALGAAAVPMNYADLYSALQAEDIDGAENPVSSYYYNQFYKAAKYYTKSGHIHSPSIILISSITWKNLSDEDREILREAARLTSDWNREAVQPAEEEVYEKLAAEGVTITDLSDIEEWENAAEAMYGQYDQYHELIEEIRSY